MASPAFGELEFLRELADGAGHLVHFVAQRVQALGNVEPVLLALVLGGMMEQSFRQALTLSRGDLTTFVGSPTTATLAVLSVLSLSLPFLLPRLKLLLRGDGQDS